MDTQYTPLIERFFDGELSPTEVKQYEELLETNEEFQKEVDLFEKAIKLLRLKNISDLKDSVQRIDASRSKSTSTVGWMKIAASIMLLAVVGMGFYSQKFSNDNLYKDAYSPANDYITNMDADLTSIEKALELYNTKQYPEAVGAFTTIELSEPQNQIAKFYLGQSLLQMDQMEQAIKTLDKVSGDYWSEAKWYVALALLKQGKEAEAKKILLDIMDADEDEAFVLKAERLQNKINSPLRKFVL